MPEISVTPSPGITVSRQARADEVAAVDDDVTLLEGRVADNESDIGTLETDVANEVATRAAADADLEANKENYVQGRHFSTTTEVRMYLDRATAIASPYSYVYVGDSHGELGVFSLADQLIRAQLGFRHVSGSGRWIPPKSIFGINNNLNAELLVDQGPAKYAANLPSAGDWIEFGNVLTPCTGFAFYGVGTFDVELHDSGGLVSTTNVTLDGTNTGPHDTGTLTSKGYFIRVKASGGSAIAWGAFSYLDTNTKGPRGYVFAHSGYNGGHFDPDTHDETWDMIDAIDPAFVVLGMATNEADAEAYRDNTEAMIQRIRATNPNRPIILFFPHLAGASGDDETWWEDAYTYFLELCRTYDCKPANFYLASGRTDLSVADPLGLVGDDDVHLSTLGNRLASMVMLQAAGFQPFQPRATDADGYTAAETIQLRNRNGDTPNNVRLYAGALLGEIVQLAVSNAALNQWIPVAAGAPTHAQHLTTRQYLEDEISDASTADRDRANHTGTQSAATISDFLAAVVASLENLADPVTVPEQLRSDAGMRLFGTGGSGTHATASEGLWLGGADGDFVGGILTYGAPSKIVTNSVFGLIDHQARSFLLKNRSAAPPTPAADEMYLYTRLNGGVQELRVRFGNGTDKLLVNDT